MDKYEFLKYCDVITANLETFNQDQKDSLVLLFNIVRDEGSLNSTQVAELKILLSPIVDSILESSATFIGQ